MRFRCGERIDPPILENRRASLSNFRHVLWSDWGRPERIAETLRRINGQPAFPSHCLDRPFSPRATALPALGT
ncbi:MAG: hypothetical protein NNA24_05830 [Nitrospira sp.]|nr:hypothetical protein [Nitrospira sp.]